MEKSMQPQVQSEQDKMVPIDTSGDPVEVTVNPEKTEEKKETKEACLLYTSPSPRDGLLSRMPSSA